VLLNCFIRDLFDSFISSKAEAIRSEVISFNEYCLLLFSSNSFVVVVVGSVRSACSLDLDFEVESSAPLAKGDASVKDVLPKIVSSGI